MIKEIIENFTCSVFESFYSVKEKINSIKKSSGIDRIFRKGSPFPDLGGSKVSNPYKQIANVFKPIKALSDSAQQIKLVTKLYSTDEVVKRPDIQYLFKRPNVLMSFKDYIQACVAFYKLYGEMIVIKEYRQIDQATKSDLPLQLWPMNPKHFYPWYEGYNDGNRKKLVGFIHNASQTRYNLSDVIWMKDFNPDSFVEGVSPTDVLKNEIDIAWDSLIFNKTFFEHGGTMSTAFIYEKPMGPEAKKRLEAELKKQYSGSSNAFKLLIMEGGNDVKNIAHSHTEMEFTEQFKLMREEMLGVFRVPKSMFSITDDLNYATSREQSRIFWEDTLLPCIQKVLEAHSYQCLNDYDKTIYLDADYSGIPAFKEAVYKRIESLDRLLNANIPLNDAVKKLDLGFPEYPWGDVPYVSFNLVPITSIGMEPENKPNEEKSLIPEDIIKKLFPEKKIDKSVRTNKWKLFDKLNTLISKRFKYALSSYFYYQTTRILKNIDENNKNFTKEDKTHYINLTMEWNEEDEILMRKVETIFRAAVMAGVNYAESFDLQASNLFDADIEMRATTASLTQRITRINDTTKDKINSIIESWIEEGKTLTEIKDLIKEQRNVMKSRAQMIAQTETTSAMNSGSMKYYELSGVEKKEWLSVQDEFVRDQHQIDGEVVKAGSKFSNGLMFPGDPSGTPDNIINCRCTLLPVIGD